ncbi:hypothetical protein PQ472_04005 [Lacticaseibacillus pabuli]|uniref:Uncharacterized protein n=1 Tax=Lacticaseibacillus pabuli TaxID=3025672 RepID=A0ABY7WTC3_9LACO|nr:hypothetical protein [Lacticaseibacillus sp. KACC 23028]WDF83414.1 hypothetical protein PQ472_04005 [Lacticaseibacillus sp. KACC 23028]
MLKAQDYRWLQINATRKEMLRWIWRSALILLIEMLPAGNSHNFVFAITLIIMAGIFAVIPNATVLNTALLMGVSRQTMWRQMVKKNLVLGLSTTLIGAVLGTISQSVGRGYFTATASLLQARGQMPTSYWRPDFIILACIGYTSTCFLANAATIWPRQHGKLARGIMVFSVMFAASAFTNIIALASQVKLTNRLLVTILAWASAVLILSLSVVLTKQILLHTEAMTA